MVNMQHNPALKKIHLWQLDAVMFHTSYRRAISTVRKMRETIGDTSNITDGVASIGWALAGREESVRMSTWLYLLLLREKIVKFDLPEGFPYGLLFDNTTTETKEDELDAT